MLYRRCITGSDWVHGGFILCFQGRPDIRMAYIQFAVSFLMSGDPATVGQILEVKGIRCLVIQTTPASVKSILQITKNVSCVSRCSDVLLTIAVLCSRAPAGDLKLWDQCRQIVHRQFDSVHSQVSSTLNVSLHSVSF